MCADHAPVTEYLYRRAVERRVPLSGTFELTPLCNFSCKMCYVRRSHAEVCRAPRPMLSAAQWVSLAQEATREGLLYLLLTGGEPLLREDFWQLYDALTAMGLLLSINTNGSLIDAPQVERFAKTPPQRINLTLYGASDEAYRRLCGVSGMYERVLRAITALKAADLPLRLNYSLTAYNAEDLDKAAALARELEVPLAVAAYMFPPIRRDPSAVGRGDRLSPRAAAYYQLHALQLRTPQDAFERYLQALAEGQSPQGAQLPCAQEPSGQVRCLAGRASFWVTWDGLLLPCGMMPQPQLDALHAPFSARWQELTQYTAALRLPHGCEVCPDRAICHPCAAIGLAETGEICGIPPYLCEMAQQLRLLAREWDITRGGKGI